MSTLRKVLLVVGILAFGASIILGASAEEVNLATTLAVGLGGAVVAIIAMFSNKDTS